jgi:hypothetical protein
MVAVEAVVQEVAPARMHRTVAPSLFGILHMALAAAVEAVLVEPLAMVALTAGVVEAMAVVVAVARASSSFHGMHRRAA